MKIDKDIDFDTISNLTEGLSGADLKAVCTEAGMFAIRSERKQVIAKDFLDAIVEPPHPKRGWGFLNFFSVNGLI